ncbi:phosphoribosylanthranilate isomerase [Cnuella takakiae]|nr:phosphoribosylanthranilate isomerase [Cnuella takakiae]
MTQKTQVESLADLGVSFAGFIFYPKSPRYVFREMTATQIRKVNNINKVGVFVNAPMDEVLHLVDECRLQMVQLHGDETPKYCDRLADYVSVVKAFRLSDNDSVEWMTRPFDDVCDHYLFDTMGAGYGGTGKKFDWTVLQGQQINKPFFLSGGIEKGDEEKIRNFTHDSVAKNLFALDINSKFELSPGIKNLELVQEFVSHIK